MQALRSMVCTKAISSSMFFLLLLSVQSKANISSLDPKIEACFMASAKIWNVPVDLLKSISQIETQGMQIVPEHEKFEDRGERMHPLVYGIMGLRNDAAMGFSLQEAAKLLTKHPNEIKADPCLNIDGAAAVLSTNRVREIKTRKVDYVPALMHFWNYKTASDAKIAIEELAFNLEAGKKTGLLRIQPQFSLAKDIRDSLLAKLPKNAFKITAQETGEYPGSDWRESPNQGGGSVQRYIVIHMTEGGFAGSLNWLTNEESGVSAHYIVRARDGYTVQMVRERARAVHVRCWNNRTIGIEMEGFTSSPDSMTEVMYDKVAKITKYLAEKFNIPKDNLHVIGHNFGESGLIGKTDLENCNDHGDPGHYFQWPKFLGMVNLK